MVEGSEVGLTLVERLPLGEYRYLHSTRGQLPARLGRCSQAAAAFRTALTLTVDDAERRWLEGRLRSVSGCVRCPAAFGVRLRSVSG